LTGVGEAESLTIRLVRMILRMSANPVAIRRAAGLQKGRALREQRQGSDA
jgi:hypothetical protein